MKILIITTSIFSSFFFGTTTTVNTTPFTESTVLNNEKSGKEIFDNECASCHTGGFKGWVSGAPDISDAEDWEKALKKGLTTMTKNVFEGTKRHEEKGGCEDCTDSEIKAAVEYIVSETKK